MAWSEGLMALEVDETEVITRAKQYAGRPRQGKKIARKERTL
jgi:hypothetical protein